MPMKARMMVEEPDKLEMTLKLTHRKFGFDHVVEMREIESALRTTGLVGIALYFASVQEYSVRHANDPTYRQRQEMARARGERWVASASVPHASNLHRKALEEIRDGNNDPRSLARDVLLATET